VPSFLRAKNASKNHAKFFKSEKCKQESCQGKNESKNRASQKMQARIMPSTLTIKRASKNRAKRSVAECNVPPRVCIFATIRL